MSILNILRSYFEALLLPLTWQPAGIDTFVYSSAVKCFWQQPGCDPFTTLFTDLDLQYLYPPYSMVLFWTLLLPGANYQVAALNILSTVATAWLLYHYVAPRRRWYVLVALIVLLIVNFAFVNNYYSGNITLLITLVTVIEFLPGHKFEKYRGILLGIFLGLKIPFLAFGAIFLILRKPRPFINMIVSCLVVNFLGILLRPKMALGYYQQLFGAQTTPHILGNLDNISFLGILTRHYGEAPKGIYIVLSLIMLAAALIAVLRVYKTDQDYLRPMCIWVLAILFVNPLTWPHYMQWFTILAVLSFWKKDYLPAILAWAAVLILLGLHFVPELSNQRAVIEACNPLILLIICVLVAIPRKKQMQILNKAKITA